MHCSYVVHPFKCLNTVNFVFCCRLQMEELSKPLRFSQQLDKAVTTNYKPVANHAYNVCQTFES